MVDKEEGFEYLMNKNFVIYIEIIEECDNLVLE